MNTTAATKIYTTHYDSPLGDITLTSNGTAICGLQFDKEKRRQMKTAEGVCRKDLPIFEEACQWLDSYFAGECPTATPLLQPAGTSFQIKIWQQLGTIPYGQTTTYGSLAEMLQDTAGKNHGYARAIGRAVGRNPILLMLPCHRVLGSRQKLTGYAAGLYRKRWLLNMEQGLQPLTVMPARSENLAEIMQVIDAAKNIMRQSGNNRQWTGGYPSVEVILQDMKQCVGYVVKKGSQIVGYFALMASPEPTYARIYKGKWIDSARPYHVVHRIAGLPNVHGVFQTIMDYCFDVDPNIRIDTHRDNHIMQHCIEKYGFAYCGIIHLASGDERLAYQRLNG